MASDTCHAQQQTVTAQRLVNHLPQMLKVQGSILASPFFWSLSTGVCVLSVTFQALICVLAQGNCVTRTCIPPLSHLSLYQLGYAVRCCFCHTCSIAGTDDSNDGPTGTCHVNIQKGYLARVC